MNNLAKNIRIIREMKGIKQVEIALLLNKTQQFISKMENGKVDITPKNVEKIAKHFGLEKQNLENFDEKMVFNISQNLNSNNGCVVNYTLPDDERKLYLEHIELLKEQNKYLQIENQRMKAMAS